MPIKNNDDAVHYLEAIEKALEAVPVSGRQSCVIIGAVFNDLDRVIAFLKGGGVSNGVTDHKPASD